MYTSILALKQCTKPFFPWVACAVGLASRHSRGPESGGLAGGGCWCWCCAGKTGKNGEEKDGEGGCCCGEVHVEVSLGEGEVVFEG
jgi:hypothetical protein